MQNKSPLQVKSVPSVCSRLPSSPGSKARGWGLIPLPWILRSSLVCTHQPMPSPVVCPALSAPIWPALPTALLWCTPQSIGPASQNPRTSPPAAPVSPGGAASSLSAARGQHLGVSSPSSQIFLDQPQRCTLSLSYPSEAICYITFPCLGFSPSKIEIHLEHLFQRI